nr:putative zinc finger, CCHC-type [Tanacetum cinerariifolium]
MVRAQTYIYLTYEEKIRESIDIKATHIFLQGLAQDIYNLVNHNEDAKQIWDKVKLLIQGSELSLQERESKLYDDFDTFTSIPGATIHSYYMRFAQVINDMHTIEMTMKPLQVNTKFANHLQTGWSKFVTDLRTSSNSRNQATIQDGRVTVPTVHGRQTPRYGKTEVRSNTTDQGDNKDTVIPAQASQEIPTPATFQTDDLDAFDSDCDDVPLAKEILMANLSFYDLDFLLKVPFHDTNIENDLGYQSMQETRCSEQPFVDNDTEIDITSDSNVISYEQYLQETKNLVVQNTSSSAQKDELLMVVIEEMSS